MIKQKKKEFTLLTNETANQLVDILPEVRIGKINKKDCPSTNKILKIVPEKEIVYLIAAYRAFSDLTSKQHSKDKIYSPKSELKKINKVLISLKELGWLTDERLEAINNMIKINISFSDKGTKFVSSHLLKGIRKTGGQHIKNPMMVYVILSLVKLIKSSTNTPKYPLIADFLYEQKIIDETNLLSAENIKKIYLRNAASFDKLSNMLQRMFLVSSLTRRLHRVSELDKKPASERTPDALTKLIVEAFA